MAQRAKFVIQHVGIYMIVVNVFQVGTVLFEQDQKIRVVRVVVYQMFRYPPVRQTEIEAINVRVATHRKIFSHRILLVAYHIIKDKNRIWTRLTRWNDVSVVGERKVADFVDRRKQIFEISILWLLQRFRIDVHVLE